MKFVKFIKITTKHTQVELHEMLNTLPVNEIETIQKFYEKFDYAEYVDVDGFQCMYAMIHENYIKDLLDTYVRLSISFKFEDVSKEALFGKIFDEERNELTELINTYIESNLDVDIVLDKILEMGQESLNEKDLLVLKSF